MPNQLPSGTVTFLFTDIEGSTQIAQKQPEQMDKALARHDALLREAIETNGGWGPKQGFRMQIGSCWKGRCAWNWRMGEPNGLRSCWAHPGRSAKKRITR